MAQYQPSQRLDYLFIPAHQAVYIRATVSVELDINEYIPSPPPVDILVNGLQITIILRALGQPSLQEGRYTNTLNVLAKIITTNLSDSINEEDATTQTNLAGSIIEKTLGKNEYTVNTRVLKDSLKKGEVNTTISKDGEIELD